MKKFISLVVLSLLCSLPMLAQTFNLNFTPGPQPWACNNIAPVGATSEFIDDQGNICLPFTTAPHPYQQITGNTFNWDSEYGVSPLPTFTVNNQQVQEFGSVVTGNGGYLQSISIADDPLRTTTFDGVIFVNGYGWPSFTLDGFVSAPETLVMNPDGSRDLTYVFVARQVEAASLFSVFGVDVPWCFSGQCLAFQWQGTFTVHQPRIVIGCSGRGGHPPCYGYATGAGHGEMSAVPVTYPDPTAP